MRENLRILLIILLAISFSFASKAHAITAPSFSNTDEFFSFIATNYGPECSNPASCRLMDKAQPELVDFLNSTISNLSENPESPILEAANQLLNTTSIERPDLFPEATIEIEDISDTTTIEIEPLAETKQESTDNKKGEEVPLESTKSVIAETTDKAESNLKAFSDINDLVANLKDDFNFKCITSASYVYCPSQDFNQELFDEVNKKIQELEAKTSSNESDQLALRAFKSIMRSLNRSKIKTRLKAKLAKRLDKKSKDLANNDAWIQYLSDIPSPREFYARINHDFGFECHGFNSIKCSNTQEHLNILTNIEAELNEAKYVAEHIENMNLGFGINRKIKRLIKAKTGMFNALAKTKYSG